MGYTSRIANRLRNWIRQDKEKAAIEFAKGAATPGMPTTGYDLLQAYGYDVVSDYLRLEHDLLSRFVDYEEMDDYPEISSAIDIYADDSTQTDMQLNRSIWCTSPDKNIELMTNRLLHKTLRTDEEIWEISRTLCKYGNDYEELLVTDQGVRGLNFLPAPTVRRVEGPRGELFGFIQDFKGRTGYSPAELQQILAMRAAMQQGGTIRSDKVTALEDWEVVHFRLRGKQRRSLYGYSVLESARWIWKRLMLLEDAALIYRLQRAPERYAFYVDVGDLPPREALAWVNKVRQQFKKKKYVNPTTGKLDLKHDPWAQDEDFFIPVRKGTESTRIEVVGSPSWQSMDDVEYFRDKLFAAMKVPKAYLGQEAGVARAVLSNEDTRFARTVLRVQRELRNGYSKICRVHMAALDIDPAQVEYELHMTTPSSIFELAQLEVRNARADLASRMREHVSIHWVLSNIFGMNDNEIEIVIAQREEDIVKGMAAEGKGQAAAAQFTEPAMGGEAGMEPVPATAPAPASQAPPGGEMAASGSVSGPEAGESMKKLFHSYRQLRSSRSLHTGGAQGISEQELFRGSREAEKRAGDKLDRLINSDRIISNRLNEVRGLVRDLVRTSSGRS